MGDTAKAEKATKAKGAKGASVAKAAKVEQPQTFDFGRELQKIGEAAAKGAQEAADFVFRFASDAAFRDRVLFQSVEVAQTAEAIVCTLAAVTNDPTVRWVCGRAQVIARGAEDVRRRSLNASK